MKIHTKHSKSKIFFKVFKPPNLIFLMYWYFTLLFYNLPPLHLKKLSLQFTLNGSLILLFFFSKWKFKRKQNSKSKIFSESFQLPNLFNCQYLKNIPLHTSFKYYPFNLYWIGPKICFFPSLFIRLWLSDAAAPPHQQQQQQQHHQTPKRQK